MKDEITLGTQTPLPRPPAGWFDYSYAVLWNGDLALIRSDRDIHAELKRWGDEVMAGNTPSQGPSLRDARLLLSQFDGRTEFGTVEVPGGHWPTVDRLADGRWLVASSRAAPNERNARLFAADGTPTGTFAMGDGINHVRCAPDGTIWVGYFDEGVFAPRGKDGRSRVSSSGLARFGPDGRVLWEFNNGGPDWPFISDCYALTLDGNTPWCCPYSDFPIIRVEDGVVDRWTNQLAGASALAVHGDHVLLVGGYGDDFARLCLIRLKGGRSRRIGEWKLSSLASPKRHGAHLLQGQGSTLHIVEPRCWTKLDTAMVRAGGFRKSLPETAPDPPVAIRIFGSDSESK